MRQKKAPKNNCIEEKNVLIMRVRNFQEDSKDGQRM